jgi:hypothetical protein
MFVPLGKKRVTELTDDGAVHLSVAFAKGEMARIIEGYSPGVPTATAVTGSIGPLSYDSASQRFTLPVVRGTDGTASVRIARVTFGASPVAPAPAPPRRTPRLPPDK